MPLRFFNTYSRNLEEFAPRDPNSHKIDIYTCGPTVYSRAHIGNFRAYIFEDLLQRHLEARGFKVHRVMNITDVDDKTILGAICAGDIGQHFPDTDESIRGISSIEILKRVSQMLAQKKARVLNIDATVITEAPKIAPHIPAMRKEIAAAVGVSDTQISVKATTNERLGPIGRGEGISAMAIATVEQD